MVSAAVQAKAKREQGQGAHTLADPPLPPWTPVSHLKPHSCTRQQPMVSVKAALHRQDREPHPHSEYVLRRCPPCVLCVRDAAYQNVARSQARSLQVNAHRDACRAESACCARDRQRGARRRRRQGRARQARAEARARQERRQRIGRQAAARAAAAPAARAHWAARHQRPPGRAHRRRRRAAVPQGAPPACMAARACRACCPSCVPVKLAAAVGP